MIKVLPDIPKIRAHWAHRCSEIPEWLEVPMADGRVINYYPQLQPAPVLRDPLDRFSELCVGYEKPADAATSNRPAGDMVRVHSNTKREKRK